MPVPGTHTSQRIPPQASGDIWVKGSRQFRDFDDYLLPAEKFAALKREQALPLAINPNSDQYLEERLQLLDEQLATVTRLAKDNELPDAILTESGLKITPLDAAVPDRAQALIDQTSQLLPRIKITELLMDVDDWTGFSRHFTHLKDGAEAKDRTLLLSAILGEGRRPVAREFGPVEARICAVRNDIHLRLHAASRAAS